MNKRNHPEQQNTAQETERQLTAAPTAEQKSAGDYALHLEKLFSAEIGEEDELEGSSLRRDSAASEPEGEGAPAVREDTQTLCRVVAELIAEDAETETASSESVPVRGGGKPDGLGLLSLFKLRQRRAAQPRAPVGPEPAPKPDPAAFDNAKEKARITRPGKAIRPSASAPASEKHGDTTRVYLTEFDHQSFRAPQDDPTLEELFGTEAEIAASAAQPEAEPSAVRPEAEAPAICSENNLPVNAPEEKTVVFAPVDAVAPARPARRLEWEPTSDLPTLEEVFGAAPASSAAPEPPAAQTASEPETEAPVARPENLPAAQSEEEVSAVVPESKAAEAQAEEETPAAQPERRLEWEPTGSLPTLEEVFGPNPTPSEQPEPPADEAVLNSEPESQDGQEAPSAPEEGAETPPTRPAEESSQNHRFQELHQKVALWLRHTAAGLGEAISRKQTPEPESKPEVETPEPESKPEVETPEPESKPEVETTEPTPKPEVETTEPTPRPETAVSEPEPQPEATVTVSDQSAAEEETDESPSDEWEPLSLFGEQAKDASLPDWGKLINSALTPEGQTVPMDLPGPQLHPTVPKQSEEAEVIEPTDGPVLSVLPVPEAAKPASASMLQRGAGLMTSLFAAGRRRWEARKENAALENAQEAESSAPAEQPNPQPSKPVPLAASAAISADEGAEHPASSEPVLSASVRSDAEPSKPDWTDNVRKLSEPEPEKTEEPSWAEETYRTYAKPLDRIGARLIFTGLLTLVSLFFTLYLHQSWTFLPQVFSGGTTVYILLALLGCMVLVNRRLYFRQWRGENGLQPELLIGIATLFTALDCISAATTLRPPFPVVVGMLLLVDLWGSYDLGLGMTTSVKILREETLSAGVSEVQDEAVGSRGLIRTKPDVEQFMRKLETRDLVARAMARYTPIALAVGLLVTLFVSFKLRQNLFWTGALVFLGSVPVAGLLAYPRLFCLLASRLAGAQAALCGYHGAEVFGGEHSILIGDADVFPPESLTLNGFKVYNGNPDRVIAYAAAAFRCSESALDPVFEQLLLTHNGRHYHVDDFRFYDSGGIGASIHQDVVLLGSLDFMRRMGVHMDKGARVKQAVYMSLNGELAAVFAVRYAPPENLRRGLASIAGNRHFKGILVTRTFLGTPSFLKAKFGIPTGAFHYPSTKERVRLSEAQMRPTGEQGAILAKDSFSAFAQAAAAGRLLRSATLGAAVLALLGGVGGLILMGILAALPAYETATALNLLFYVAAWLVPTLLLTAWGRHF